MARSRGLSVRLITGRCLGPRAVNGLAAVLRATNAHRLVAAYCGEAQPHLVCLRCGAWARGRPLKLLNQCEGTATVSGRLALRKLAAGMMPAGAGRSPLALEGAYFIRDGTVDFGAAVQFGQ